MIRYDKHNQSCLPSFEQFFGVPLDQGNRWIKINKVIPWNEVAEAYYQNMSSSIGRPAKDVRLVIGAVIVKHKLCLNDEETIEQIRETPICNTLSACRVSKPIFFLLRHFLSISADA